MLSKTMLSYFNSFNNCVKIIMGQANSKEFQKRCKGKHPECNEGIYSKGEKHLEKVYSHTSVSYNYENKHYQEEQSLGYWPIGCDNCIELWKRDDNNKKQAAKNKK